MKQGSFGGKRGDTRRLDKQKLGNKEECGRGLSDHEQSRQANESSITQPLTSCRAVKQSSQLLSANSIPSIG